MIETNWSHIFPIIQFDATISLTLLLYLLAKHRYWLERNRRRIKLVRNMMRISFVIIITPMANGIEYAHVEGNLESPSLSDMALRMLAQNTSLLTRITRNYTLRRLFQNLKLLIYSHVHFHYAALGKHFDNLVRLDSIQSVALWWSNWSFKKSQFLDYGSTVHFNFIDHSRAISLILIFIEWFSRLH